jgi:hypothetical protein
MSLPTDQANFNQGLLDLRLLDKKPATHVLVEMAEHYGLPGEQYGESSNDFRMRITRHIEKTLQELNQSIQVANKWQHNPL